MLILNPKVGTVLRKLEKYLFTTNPPTFFEIKMVLCFVGAVIQLTFF